MSARNITQNRKFYKLKVEKETNIPLFHLTKKNTNGDWVTDETFNEISGHLKNVELSSYVYEGDEIDTLKLLFDEDDNSGGQFQLETNLNYLSRGILNALAGATNVGHVLIRVYTSKAKDGSSKVFPQAYVEINKAKAGWKYEPDELPKAKEVTVNRKTFKDAAELDAFFKKLVPEINGKIVSEFEVKTEMKERPKESEATTTKGWEPPAVEGDELPF